MGLVDHREVAFGDDFAEAPLAHRRIGAQQVVIDDDDVRLGRAVAHASDEAVRVPRALATQALLGRRGDLAPERQVVRQVLDLAAVARRRGAGPLRDRLEPLAIGRRQSGLRFAQAIEPVPAEVVGAALHVGRLDRRGQAPPRARARPCGRPGPGACACPWTRGHAAPRGRREADTRGSCRCRCRLRRSAFRPDRTSGRPRAPAGAGLLGPQTPRSPRRAARRR